jgi:hypothetical protein
VGVRESAPPSLFVVLSVDEAERDQAGCLPFDRIEIDTEERFNLSKPVVEGVPMDE